MRRREKLRGRENFQVEDEGRRRGTEGKKENCFGVEIRLCILSGKKYSGLL